MLKTIILVRHGETEKDKNNPERRLTLRGEKQVKKTAVKLKGLVDKKTKIISTNTNRTIETATIIAKQLNLRVAKTDVSLRVDNFSVVEETASDKKDLTFLYFDLFENQKLPSKVASPIEVANRFLKLVEKINQETLILVGHGAALESFALYQSLFFPKKDLTRELKYGEFIVLERSKC